MDGQVGKEDNKNHSFKLSSLASREQIEQAKRSNHNFYSYLAYQYRIGSNLLPLKTI